MSLPHILARRGGVRALEMRGLVMSCSSCSSCISLLKDELVIDAGVAQFEDLDAMLRMTPEALATLLNEVETEEGARAIMAVSRDLKKLLLPRRVKAPLIRVARRGLAGVARQLLTCYTSEQLDMQGPRGVRFTALQEAIRQNHEQLVGVLMELSSKEQLLRPIENATPLDLAISCGSPGVLMQVLEVMPKEQMLGVTLNPLENAMACEREIEVFDVLRPHITREHLFPPLLSPALIQACYHSRPDILRCLLAHDTRDNRDMLMARNEDGMTALMVACHNDDTEAVSILLDYEEHVDMQLRATDNTGKTGSCPLRVVLCVSSACPLRVLCMSSACPLHVLCVSSACPLRVLCMSSACPLHVLCVSSACPLRRCKKLETPNHAPHCCSPLDGCLWQLLECYYGVTGPHSRGTAGREAAHFRPYGAHGRCRKRQYFDLPCPSRLRPLA